jgi:hypothetical protein
VKPLAATAIALTLLVLAAPATAQTGTPFGPLDSSGPVTPPPEPEPPPEPQSSIEEDDGELGATESLGLAGIAALIIGAVFVAITREGRRMDRRARRANRKRQAKRGGRPADLHRRATVGATAGRTNGDRRTDAKRPPPPPRKRRAKAKRR